jgi:hypothetical protein
MELLKCLLHYTTTRNSNRTCGLLRNCFCTNNCDTIAESNETFTIALERLRLLEQSMMMRLNCSHDHSCFGYRRKSCCVWIQLEQPFCYCRYTFTFTNGTAGCWLHYHFANSGNRTCNGNCFCTNDTDWLQNPMNLTIVLERLLEQSNNDAQLYHHPACYWRKSCCVWIQFDVLRIFYIHQWNRWKCWHYHSQTVTCTCGCYYGNRFWYQQLLIRLMKITDFSIASGTLRLLEQSMIMMRLQL